MKVGEQLLYRGRYEHFEIEKAIIGTILKVENSTMEYFVKFNRDDVPENMQKFLHGEDNSCYWIASMYCKKYRPVMCALTGKKDDISSMVKIKGSFYLKEELERIV